jgi:hypothetical protein
LRIALEAARASASTTSAVNCGSDYSSRAAAWVPENELTQILIDDFTKENPVLTSKGWVATDLTLSVKAILAHYRELWAVEIDIRDGQAYYGLGQDPSRKWRRMVGSNTFCLMIAAARTL